MNTWQDLIKTRMRESNLTQETLAEKLEVSQGSIAHWLSGRRKPDTEIISNIMKAVGVKEIILNNDGSAENLINQGCGKNSFCIESLNVTASAGSGYLNSDVQEVVKMIEFDVEQARTIFNGLASRNLKIINVRGDSMKGTLESGDSVYVDSSITHFDGDGIYVFSFGLGMYVKRLQLVKNTIKVKSDNPLYETWDINEGEINQLFIHGKVMLSQSMILQRHG